MKSVVFLLRYGQLVKVRVRIGEVRVRLGEVRVRLGEVHKRLNEVRVHLHIDYKTIGYKNVGRVDLM